MHHLSKLIKFDGMHQEIMLYLEKASVDLMNASMLIRIGMS